ncbi:MAG: hypothetical protein JSS87_12765 [Acidobacteria bacterium]|nr:hypothetical protein [Acidobacteriota bacterium]
MIQQEIARRRYIRKHQLELSFPETPEEICKTAIVLLQWKRNEERIILERKPSEFPAGWMRLAERNPGTWRILYRREWHKKRIAQGLPGLSPHELNATNAPLKKQSRSVIPFARKTA